MNTSTVGDLQPCFRR